MEQELMTGSKATTVVFTLKNAGYKDPIDHYYYA